MDDFDHILEYDLFMRMTRLILAGNMPPWYGEAVFPMATAAIIRMAIKDDLSERL